VFRGALLAVVVAVHGVAAAPLPHAVTANDLRNPVSADELARWADRLGMGKDELARQVIAITGAIGAAHRGVLAPARPVLRFTGTGQGWGLFANPDTHPDRLVVRGRGPDGERVLYQRRDADHAWDAPVLTYRRIRALGDSGGFRGRPSATFQRFAKWVGRRALASFPELDAVEVAMERTHTTLPGRPPDPAVQKRHAVTVRRTE
jgi:hypothetical protein